MSSSISRRHAFAACLAFSLMSGTVAALRAAEDGAGPRSPSADASTWAFPSGERAEAGAQVPDGAPSQGVTATGMITFAAGACLPDAVLVGCDSNVRELRGPGGAGFFSPYVGLWVQLTGAEQQCAGGSAYVDVVTINAIANPCSGIPTPTPGGPTMPPPPATATPVGTAVPPPGAGNVALGRQFFASTTQPPTDPSMAGDGNPLTGWLSFAGRDPYRAAQNRQWIYVNLGTEHSVQDMRMLWNAAAWHHPRGYAVYAYIDGWRLLADTSYGDGDDSLHLPYGPVESQYFMLWLVNPALGGSGYELMEWEIAGAASILTTNLAAGKAAVALNSQPGFEAGRVVDADEVTDWRSVTIPSWVYVNFGTGVSIDRARLRWAAGQHATQYSLYAWNGWGWVGLSNVSAGAGGDEMVRFAPVRTQYLMMYAHAGPGPGVALREFEAYEYRSGAMPDRTISANRVGGIWTGLSGAGRPMAIPSGTVEGAAGALALPGSRPDIDGAVIGGDIGQLDRLPVLPDPR